jgi:hypothetical protein
LLNRSSLTLNGSASSTVNGSSWTLAGLAGDSSTLMAMAHGAGIGGGDGGDWLRNEGNVLVTLGSTLNATGGANGLFSKASADTQLTARTDAFGLAGGAGGDLIENTGHLNVGSTATVNSTKAAVTLAGPSDSNAFLVARALSTGIDGGGSADEIRNDGTLLITADAVSTIVGGASASWLGKTDAGGAGTAQSTAIGIGDADGATLITSSKKIEVTATGTSTVSNDSSSGLLFSSAQTFSEAGASATALGISVGAGKNTIVNNNEVQSQAIGIGHGFAYASGGHVSFAGNGEARSNVQVKASAFGISAGNGDNTIANHAMMLISSLATTMKATTVDTIVCVDQQKVVETVCTEVLDENGNPVLDENGNPVMECHEEETIDTICDTETTTHNLGNTPTYAGANGNGAFGDGTATSMGTAEADAVGIHVGSGANVVLNTAAITVTSDPEAKTTVFADGDLAGDATGTATSTARARSVGIEAGNGANEIVNTGGIFVTAAPTAQARSEVTGGEGVCINYLFGKWCGGGGDGIGTSTAVFESRAVGIQVGEGANRIVNAGTIEVVSAPEADGGFTADVIFANTETLKTTLVSSAIGIATGNGNNEVVNDASGTIDVEARDLTSFSCNQGSACTRTIEAFGIKTGAGHDVIENHGRITATVAIDSGIGNDRVVLGANSQTSGFVQLGAGNDRLVWSAGASLANTADGSAGTDTFALGGSVNSSFQMAMLDGKFLSFERFHKEGPGEWTLLGNRNIDWTVEGGTLAVANTITGTIDTSAAGSGAVVKVMAGGALRAADANDPAALIHGGTLTNQGIVEAIVPSGVAVETLSARFVRWGLRLM